MKIDRKLFTKALWLVELSWWVILFFVAIIAILRALFCFRHFGYFQSEEIGWVCETCGDTHPFIKRPDINYYYFTYGSKHWNAISKKIEIEESKRIIKIYKEREENNEEKTNS